MRIIPDDVMPVCDLRLDKYTVSNVAYSQDDTIEITDAEWDEIYDSYNAKYRLNFSDPEYPSPNICVNSWS
jgi:hypothetical protein